jgi:nitrate/nitrite transport system permease protein
MSSTIHLRAVNAKSTPAPGTAPAETAVGRSTPQTTPPAPSATPAPAETSGAEKSLANRFGEALFNHLLPPVIVLSLLLAIWEILCSQPGSSLPSFTQVLSDTRELIVHPFYNNGGNDVGLGWQILASLERVAYGYSLAVIGGIALGVLIGQFSWAMKGLDPIFQVLRTVPPLAWLPLSLAGFQDSHPSAIFVIFITAIWPIIINTSVGVRNIPEDYRNVARVIRLKGARYFWKIMLPAAAPYIFSGLRIGVGLSWLAIVAAEMLVGGVGIGFFIWDAWNSSLISDIILALIYVGIVGFILDRMVAYLGRVVTRSTSAS